MSYGIVRVTVVVKTVKVVAIVARTVIVIVKYPSK
jgi:hypothetical protein